MKFLVITILPICLVLKTSAQKLPLKIDSYLQWTEVNRPAISNDGKFASYRIENQPLGSGTNVILSVKTGWKVSYGSLDEPSFSNDSKEYFAKLSNDTLLNINLTTHKIKKIGHVNSYQLFMKGADQWLITKYNSPNNELRITTLGKQGLLSYNSVDKYVVSPNGKSIILICSDNTSINRENLLYIIDLDKKSKKLVFKGEGIHDLIFSENGNSLAFMVNLASENRIWEYSIGSEHAIDITNSLHIKDNLKINTGLMWKFSHDGKKLFFSLQENKPLRVNLDSNLIIYNFQDPYLPNSILPTDQYLAVYNLIEKKSVQLTYKYDEVLFLPKSTPDDIIVIKTTTLGARDTTYIPFFQKKSYFVCSTNDGDRSPIKIDSQEELSSFTISPSGSYIVYYDPEQNGYFCYSKKNKQSFLILSNRNNELSRVDKLRFPNKSNVGITGWLSDKNLLINGSHDIWNVDLQNNSSFNLTKNLSISRDIVYNLPLVNYNVERMIDGSVILSAFDLKTKKYALYQWKIAETEKPIRLNFQPIYMGDIQEVYSGLTDNDFVKAKYKNAFIVKKESATEAPNYFYTVDFRKFDPISNIQPQKSFNWMTSELHTYRDSFGNMIEAILYKPEDFDSTKRYPLVFNYYETKSNGLNLYESPTLIGGDIPIAWLVSNGYLVAKVNMEGKAGKIAEGTLRSINAAADHFERFKWVDSTKMAISGHSFGGFETNYIIVNSTRFAAAVSGAGISNSIQFYNETDGDFSGQFIRNLAMTLVKPLTDAPLLYLKYSPIAYANRIKTPLLIMHNPNDPNVDFRQSLSFYYELRGLKKKVWMLSYNNEGHGIARTMNKLDFNTKLPEFLDYFLKGKPMPLWMERSSQ
jgi:dipeptidyl aminopeptidase/acylaminoacyl peptidase